MLVRVLVGILLSFLKMHTNQRNGPVWWLRMQTRSEHSASFWYELTFHLALGSNVWLESRVRAGTINQKLSVQTGAQ